MQRLILLRHGEAQPGGEGEDLDRPLTPAGRAAAAATGVALRQAGFAPDVAIVSPAARARQTWEAARPTWGPVAMREVAALYEASPKTLLAQAQAQAATTVLVVGHNPGLQELAAALTARALGELGPPPDLGFPPAAAAVFDRTPDGWVQSFRHGETARA